MPESYGIYILAVSIALILLISIDTGINQSLLRYVSEALHKKNKELAKANFRYLLRLKISITLIVAVLLIILAYPLSLYVFKKPALFLPLIVSGFYILVNSVGSFYSSYFYIIKKLGYLTVKQIIFEVIRISGALVMFFVVAEQHHVIGTIGVITISMLLAVLYLRYHLKKIQPFIFEATGKKEKEADRKRMISFSLYFGTIGSLLVIFGYVDIIIIGIFLDASYVGFYSVALALVIGILGFLNLSQILLPLLTGMDDDKIQKEFNTILKYIAVLAVPAIFGILVLGNYFILIYGPEYAPAVWPFYVLSLLILEIPLIDMISPLFSAKERQQIILKGIIFSTVLNIILNIIFIQLFMKISLVMAIVGAAVATVISQGVYLMILLYYAKRDYNIHLQFGFLVKPFIASVIMAIVLFAINSFFAAVPIFMVIIEIFLGAGIYFLIIFLIKGLGKEDLLLLNDILKKFF